MQDQVLQALVAPVEPPVQKARNQGAGEEEAAGGNQLMDPEPPKTTMDALLQRLEKYKNAEQQAKEGGESSKARRMGRIVKVFIFIFFKQIWALWQEDMYLGFPTENS